MPKGNEPRPNNNGNGDLLAALVRRALAEQIRRENEALPPEVRVRVTHLPGEYRREIRR